MNGTVGRTYLPDYPETAFVLKLEAVEPGTLTENSDAFLKGLVCLSLALNDRGFVPRTDATKIMVDMMELKDFVRGDIHYSNAKRMAATIVDCLCRKNLISRLMGTMRENNQTGPSTRGYVFTHDGRNLLASLLPRLLGVYQQRVKQALGRIDQHLPENPTSGIQVDLNDPKVLERLERNAQAIDLLTLEYGKAVEDIQSCEKEISEIQRKAAESIGEYKQLMDDLMATAAKCQRQIRELLAGVSNDRPPLSNSTPPGT